ncbi:hypothetical protein [Xanthomonas sp. 3307]|nr:hypothetical protein [Xanthomonas sp. 3307]MBB5942321.1 hypothetical protein [Xanthomonas sp. 3307]
MRGAGRATRALLAPYTRSPDAVQQRLQPLEAQTLSIGSRP